MSTAVTTLDTPLGVLGRINLSSLTLSFESFLVPADLFSLVVGNRAAQVLAAGLPRGWRVVLVDRNS